MVRLSVRETTLRREYQIICEQMRLTNVVLVSREPSDFEAFQYWFEQQRFYLTDTQFLFCQSQWLQMVIDVFEQRDELEF